MVFLARTKCITYSKLLCRGATLVELIVVVSIMALLTGVTLVSHNQFRSVTLLDNLAYDVAFSIRDAQVSASSVREDLEIGGGFTTGYGVYFTESESDAYISFSDVNQNNIYDFDPLPEPLCNTECLDEFTLNRYAISDVCGVLSDDTAECFSTGVLTELNIVFERSNPDAFLVSDCSASVYKEVSITVQSESGEERHVRVAPTGQISVSDTLPERNPAPAC